MDNTNLTQNFGVINPKTTRYKAYDLIKERYVNVDQYGRTAKRLYKQYIDILGYEPEMVMPNTLKYYPETGRFYKYKPEKENSHGSK